ncbi:hypothetical protein EB796_004339 [Bugula neritina]|uniref:Zonadhesin n=1 Tax=Bugula neritina TaxID=10212 RepID=A0A7J7KFB8_BUGNE|nr:hypothetical protein EB796_004339 [Bugula neritina]
MKLGIEIQYSGGHIFEMKVRPSYQSNICGLCGNYNLDPADDFTTGPKCAGRQMPPTPFFYKISNEHKWGNTWRTDDFDSDVDCDDNKPCVAADPLTPCSEQEKRDARTICEAIKRFFEDDEEAKKCLKLFEDPEEHVKNVLEECEFDFCRMKTEETICDYLSDFAETCINTHSIPVQYRAPNQCPVKCGANEEFKVEKGVCIKNCEGKPLDLLCKENDPSYITVQCQCVEGFVRHGEACIPKEECSKLISCEIEGMVTPLPAQTTALMNDCTRKVTCETNGRNSSEPHLCGDNSVCVINTCFCLKGYRNEGAGCKDINECNEPNECDVEGATCRNRPGTYLCECEKGYKFTGECEDINECDGDHDCPKHSGCKNLVPSYRCDCDEGYTKSADGKTCDV